MTRIAAIALLVCMSPPVLAAGEAKPAVCVLDGADVQPMRDCLKRLDCPFADLKRLNPQQVSAFKVLIVCGTKPALGGKAETTLRGFLGAGGSVLGVGAGATALIDSGLFDAKTYSLTGTTVHMTKFCGYHRLTFGYPGAKPYDGWTAGVSNLLRATQGPLMMLGPKAASILSYDSKDIYSAAAFQRVGKGIVLLIGPDPQGGSMYHEVDKSKPVTGDELGTDGLIANAVAFLLDPCCNIIPNAGFEANTDLPPVQSNWQVSLSNGATREWRKKGAPEGKVFLEIACPAPNGNAAVQPYLQLVVERGAEYEVAFMYKSTAEAQLTFTPLKGRPSAFERGRVATVSVPPSKDWKRFQAEFRVPADVSYARPTLKVQGEARFCLDDFTMKRK